MGDGGFRISSKAWPEARLLICFTSMSEKGAFENGKHPEREAPVRFNRLRSRGSSAVWRRVGIQRGMPSPAPPRSEHVGPLSLGSVWIYFNRINIYNVEEFSSVHRELKNGRHAGEKNSLH